MRAAQRFATTWGALSLLWPTIAAGTGSTTPVPAPVVTSPAQPVTVNADKYTISGTAQERTLVRVWADANRNGVIDRKEEVVASQALKSGVVTFAIKTPLRQNASNGFLVTATTSDGRRSPPTAVPLITEDSRPPNTSITSGPPNPAASGDASFDFVSSEPESTFACSLDSGAFAPCASPTRYSGLAAGPHTFAVRAVDLAQNVDRTPATHAWTISGTDTIAPDTVISSAPTNPTASTDATFAFTSTEPGSTFSCALDAAPFADCASPASYSALAPGVHEFAVRATDPSGNTDPTPATTVWTISAPDVTPPDTAITAGPPNPSASPDATFSFTSTEPGSTFACQLDGAAFASCTSPQGYTGLAPATHVFAVVATDAAGNADPTPATASWTVVGQCGPLDDGDPCTLDTCDASTGTVTHAPIADCRLLSGPPAAPALDALAPLPPVPVEDGDLLDGIILTRLDLHLDPAATVGDVNAAIEAVGGTIVTMHPGLPTVTISIPRPADLAALSSVVEQLRAAPGIAWTDIARAGAPKVLPPPPAGEPLRIVSELDHLLPTRFPAAWNASRLATDGCATRKVHVVVADHYDTLNGFLSFTSAYARFNAEVPGYAILADPTLVISSGTHGLDVTTTLAALLDGTNPTGAVPFPNCLELSLLQLGNLTESQRALHLALSLPSGKFVLNYSLGYQDTCDANVGCQPDQVGTRLDLPLSRAYAAADWKLMSSSRWDDFLVAVAAGNERNKAGTAIYPGLGVAAFDSFINIATLADPLFSFVRDAANWNPQPAFSATFPPMIATTLGAARLETYIRAAGVDAISPANNVLIAGSTDEGTAASLLGESVFSDSGADLYAVGRSIWALDGSVDGTSFSAPQVAGLAAYLWLLSPGLRAQPASVTRRAILDNAIIGHVPVLDAYASALSLDAAAPPTAASAPVRLAILDVVDAPASPTATPPTFDEADLEQWWTAFFEASGLPKEPVNADYGRHDLNGDGFTGGFGTEQFDLDRSGSTHYGATSYSTVQQSIDGQAASFDENALTDLQILCYYAYSPLYTGDSVRRGEILGGACSPPTISPSSVTLAPGGTQGFSANTLVTWSTTGGSITSSGFYTAPATPGTYDVVATSVLLPSTSARATVQVLAPGSISIAPATAVVPPGGTLTFTATAVGATGPLSWQASHGTITPSGFTATYTAPVNPPAAFDEISVSAPNAGIAFASVAFVDPPGVRTRQSDLSAEILGSPSSQGSLSSDPSNFGFYTGTIQLPPVAVACGHRANVSQTTDLAQDVTLGLTSAAGSLVVDTAGGTVSSFGSACLGSRQNANNRFFVEFATAENLTVDLAATVIVDKTDSLGLTVLGGNGFTITLFDVATDATLAQFGPDATLFATTPHTENYSLHRVLLPGRYGLVVESRALTSSPNLVNVGQPTRDKIDISFGLTLTRP